jgi:predicted neuraminidase
MRSQPIFPQTRFRSVHAATIAARPDGSLMAAWFAGTHEGAPDVVIYTARYIDGVWQAPSLALSVPGVPCWNPVLFQKSDGQLILYTKIGPTIPAWTGVIMRSKAPTTSQQVSPWSPPVLLPAGLQGPAKNKPIELADGTILCGASRETWRSWSCWVERSTDGGATWSLHGPITAPASDLAPGPNAGEPVSATWDQGSRTLALPDGFAGVIQPTLWEQAPGYVVMLMRTTRAVGFVCRSESHDAGQTWSPAEPLDVPCPNSGLDAARLPDGRAVLACNPVQQGRTPLALLVSGDEGRTWRHALTLEDGRAADGRAADGPEYSYPSVVLAIDLGGDAVIHVVYTWRRERIQHVALSPDELRG